METEGREEVATTMVHALYHRFFHLVDVHNPLRQGEVAMADVWATHDWAHRHFAEGLGFWEGQIFPHLSRSRKGARACVPCGYQLSKNEFKP